MRTSFLKYSIPFFALGIVVGSTANGIAASRGSAVFNDVPSGSYYDDAVGELFSLGVIKGYDATTFGPDDYVTRGQVAVMLQRFRAEMLGIELTSSSARSTRSTVSKSSSSRSSSSNTSLAANEHGYFRFSTGTFSISESSSDISITILRTGGTEGAATVAYVAEGITATAGDDFNAVSGTMSFPDGVSSKTISISIPDDNVGEGTETFKLTLSNATGGAGIGTPSTATISIIDNEQYTGSSKSSSASQGSTADKEISLGASAYSVLEDGDSIAVTINRTGSTSGSAQVQYATSNGTGKSGSEYTGISGTLTFNAGETTKTLTINITDDNSSDGAKNFSILLSNPSGAALGTSSAIITIYDDDNTSIPFGSGSFKFADNDYDADRDVGYIDVTVQRVSGTVGTATVQYETRSNTASPGLDFTNKSGTLTFGPGEAAKTIRITIATNGTGNGESFYVDLSNPSSGSNILSPSTTEVTLY